MEEQQKAQVAQMTNIENSLVRRGSQASRLEHLNLRVQALNDKVFGGGLKKTTGECTLEDRMNPPISERINLIDERTDNLISALEMQLIEFERFV